MSDLPIIVAITGASGAIYGIRALELLRAMDVETHLVISRAGVQTIAEETDWTLDAVRALAGRVHGAGDIGASISSGSYRTAGMLVAPCSVKTASEIAHGITGNLIARAADVVLKERRRLVVLFRETPLHTGHLRTLTQLSETGAVIMPPVPAFYARPQSLAEMVDHTVSRALDQFGLDTCRIRRWKQDGRCDP